MGGSGFERDDRRGADEGDGGERGAGAEGDESGTRTAGAGNVFREGEGTTGEIASGAAPFNSGWSVMADLAGGCREGAAADRVSGRGGGVGEERHDAEMGGSGAWMAGGRGPGERGRGVLAEAGGGRWDR